ncbi:hypothetical protein ACFLRI_05650, partial [Bacteroidota bacterium]
MRFLLISLLLLFFYVLYPGSLKAQHFYDNPVAFSTNNTQLTIWNGNEYVPFFIKGINLGISVPGTFPGELAANKEQYFRWFHEIKEAGFNCIRLYTLHYPHFYELLDSFNNENQNNPLFFFQGVWLNEENNGSNNDIYSLDTEFSTEIEENVDCVHGNRTISARFGKAFGSYSNDASVWCIGYIIGRETFPNEILGTNMQHPSDTFYEGIHFSIHHVRASETWFVKKLDYLVDYEYTNYQVQKPVSVSSWPTLDPILHSEEKNREEDTAFVDLSGVELTDAPGGFFISYHAYPYYPDFVSTQSSYQHYADDYGPNSYFGYLTELKSHYQ